MAKHNNDKASKMEPNDYESHTYTKALKPAPFRGP